MHGRALHQPVPLLDFGGMITTRVTLPLVFIFNWG